MTRTRVGTHANVAPLALPSVLAAARAVEAATMGTVVTPLKLAVVTRPSGITQALARSEGVASSVGTAREAVLHNAVKPREARVALAHSIRALSLLVAV